MSFNFDIVLDRRNSDSGKWNMYPEDVLPLWVADMDFLSPPAVVEALKQRVEQGTFGYGRMEGSTALREAIRAWARSQYHWEFAVEEMHFLPNLVSALFAWARVIGDAGDEIVAMLPNYPPFMAAISNAGKTLNRVEMKQTDAEGILHYELDFEALEAAITPRTKLLLLCNPHNPVGRIYTRTELERLAEIVLKHDLYVCSDEIHGDLRLTEELPHIPFASISPQVAQRTITVNAPSKTFNIPGLGLGYMVVQNKDLLAQYQKIIGWMIPHPNLLGIVGALAAYEQGDAWLSAVLPYLRANRDFVVEFVRREMPDIKITVAEGTYLAWLDCRALGLEPTPFEFFLNRAKVALSNGKDFGSGYEGYVRLNFGCPRATLETALNRMKAAVAAAQAAAVSSVS